MSHQIPLWAQELTSKVDKMQLCINDMRNEIGGYEARTREDISKIHTKLDNFMIGNV